MHPGGRGVGRPGRPTTFPTTRCSSAWPLCCCWPGCSCSGRPVRRAPRQEGPFVPREAVISMGRKLDGAVVVVTGASSGIGRATGLAFADRGARVVLAARRVDALEEPAGECRAVGGQALAVPTDTTDE